MGEVRGECVRERERKEREKRERERERENTNNHLSPVCQLAG